MIYLLKFELIFTTLSHGFNLNLNRMSIQLLKPEPLYGYSMETITLNKPPTQLLGSTSDLR